MTLRSPIRSRRAALGQAVIPVALLALLALVGGLTYHVRRMESSHRATAESALRDYAAFAAWQFSREADEHVSMLAHNGMHQLDHLFRRPEPNPVLPSPAILLQPRDTVACAGIGGMARFAFRIDLPAGGMTVVGDTAGAADAETRAAIVERLRARAETKATRGNGVRLLVDTILGARRAIAWGVVIGSDSAPRTIYGVDGDPSAIENELRHVAGLRPILPPSLLGGRSLDEVLTLRVLAADGGELFALNAGKPGTISASEATPADVGGLTTSVSILPRSAGMLLIGGMPGSRLPVLALILVTSAILAGLALVQLRRGRELARLRTRFVANVSHELRTPLAQISMFSETLLLGRERSADERQHFLSVIFRETRRLTNLVESVLGFSRAEAGASPLRPEPRDVAADVREAVRAFSPLAAAAGVELRTVLEERCVALVEPDALRQVLINLLDNAVKFGPEGQHVTVSAVREGAEVVVSVTDEGPGIPPAQRRKAFEPFAQAVHAHTRSAPGAGIGLAVVAELIAAHAGRVWIEDGPGGRGTRVVFALPAVRIAPPAESGGTATAETLPYGEPAAGGVMVTSGAPE